MSDQEHNITGTWDATARSPMDVDVTDDGVSLEIGDDTYLGDTFEFLEHTCSCGERFYDDEQAIDHLREEGVIEE